MTKVFEFGGGKVREHIGGIYDFLRSRGTPEWMVNSGMRIEPSTTAGNTSKQSPPTDTAPSTKTSTKNVAYAARKEQQKRISRAEKAVKESERRIESMENRIAELDALLCDPKNASDMTLVTEYTQTKRSLDEEMERWEQLSSALEAINKE